MKEGMLEPPAIGGRTNGDRSAAEAVAERLSAIVDACGGRNVETDGTDLWFGLEDGGDLQVRLSGNRDAPCYDRSTNLAISYGGQPSQAPVASRFRTIVDRIKALDASLLPDVETAFRPAADAIVQRLSNRAAHAPVAPPVRPADAVQLGSESRRGQALNVVFLDLCLGLGDEAPETLRPMHWGYWPRPPAGSANIIDPQEAFSLHLLSHVPAGVRRVLDVGCGLGCNARILSARGKHVTAISPVAHHCAVIENARLPNVDVRCTRFEDFAPPAEPFDLLLFSESLNHFLLNDAFARQCARFLTDAGFVLLADDLSTESVRRIESLPEFRILHASDITENVAPTAGMFARHLPIVTAYQRALMATLALYDAPLATRAREILDAVENSDLRALFAGTPAPPAPKGRYMLFLLQRATRAAG